MAQTIQTAISRHGQKGFEGPSSLCRKREVIASEIADVGIPLFELADNPGFDLADLGGGAGSPRGAQSGGQGAGQQPEAFGLLSGRRAADHESGVAEAVSP